MWNATKAVGLTLVIGTTAFAAGGCGDGAGSSDLPADCSALERPGGGAEAVPAGVLPAGMTWQWQSTGAVEHGLDVSMYDVDLADTTASEIAELQAEGHVRDLLLLRRQPRGLARRRRRVRRGRHRSSPRRLGR